MTTETDGRVAAHTPGPWEVCAFGRFPGINSACGTSIVVYGDDGEPDAGVRGTEPDENAAEVAANARLIAAAPDLLKQLQSVLACMEITGQSLGDMDAIRAAIAKAAGADALSPRKGGDNG